MPWAEVFLSAVVAAALTLLVTLYLSRRRDKRRLTGVSRRLYKELRSHLGTLEAERFWPGDFLGKRSDPNRSAGLTSSTWDELSIVFAEFVSGEDYQTLESLYARFEHIGGYPVRCEWAENGDRPADGIVGEYREDYLPDRIADAKQAIRMVGRWAGYPRDQIEEDIGVSAPQPEPGYDDLPTESDMDDLSHRIRELAPQLEDRWVRQISRDIQIIVVEERFIPGDSTSEFRVRTALDRRLDRFGLRDENAKDTVWEWVVRNHS